MGIDVKIKEISLDRDLATEREIMALSVEIICDEYRIGSHAPRIECRFATDHSSRRIVLPVTSFEYNAQMKKAVCYGTYTYFLDYLFWDEQWKNCKLSFDVDYEGVSYHQVNFEVEFADQSGRLGIGENTIDISMEEDVDARLPKEPNALQTVLASLLKLANMVIAVFLIPWFMVDAFCMLTLRTEFVDPNLRGGFLNKFAHLVGWRYFSFCRNSKGLVGMKVQFLKLTYQISAAFHGKKKGVLFLSNRREDMTGNFAYVFDYMKDAKDVRYSYWLHPEELKEASLGMILDMAWKAGKAKVIVVDDFVQYFNFFQVSRKTEIIQLWHACGAFKTFGFARLGKRGAPTQKSKQHRNYSAVFVSSKNIAKYYAEGFGLSEEKAIPYGVPRTDIFFDKDYRENTIKTLYSEHPVLKGKKVIMFAPTFRGDGKNSAHYERERFNPNTLIEQLPEEYVLIIKHHPFVTMEYKIKESNKNRILDFSKESEINDLLFITDVLITDYSSVVYEASLLNIPMLFYAYDLENYIASRDFYSNYEYFVPGKIVRTEEEMLQALVEEDFEQDKVEKFAEDNFDIRDGRASERVANYILERARG